MRAFKTGLVGLFLVGTAGIGGCDKVADCAGLSCHGSIAEGSLEITGNTQIDGVLRGVGSISTAVTETTAIIDGEIRGVCTDLGIADCTGDLGAVVASVNAELSARFAFSASLTIDVQPAKCEASVDVAVEATARCEGEVDPGSVELSCEGQCSGGCSGSCTGDLSCEVTAPSITCSGSCEGSCDLSAGGACSGTCHGDCDAGCSATNADGQCNGTCDGNCTGQCELTVAASCSGSCTGKCLVEQGSAECTGEVSCRGSCDATCDGHCEGSVTPPSASVECQASAHAEASASIQCTPPEVNVDFSFGAAASAEEQARLTVAISSIKAHFGVIVAAIAKADLLVDATADLSGSVSVLAESDVDVDAALLVCLADQIPAAIAMLDDAGGKLTASASASASFTGCVTSAGGGC